MDVADRLFARVVESLRGPAHEALQPYLRDQGRDYWKRIIRLAALLHDVGHLPFSHAAEERLMPHSWDHERMTAEIIRNSEIATIINAVSPPVKLEDIVDLAWQPRKRRSHEPDKLPDPWRTVLSEIITGDSFGADRIDYLLRDSLHAGVAYGRFDPDRLISGLLIELDEADNPVLGLDIGSIHAAEALLLARYFMYTQVYMHDVRRVYDAHLQDFLIAWLPDGRFSPDWREMLKVDDNKVLAAMWDAFDDSSSSLKPLANRIIGRQHFKTVYELHPGHKRLLPTIVEDVATHLKERFGEENVHSDRYGPKSEANQFRVRTDDGNLSHSTIVSDVISRIPPVEVGLVFTAPELAAQARLDLATQFKPVFDGRKMPRKRNKRNK